MSQLDCARDWTQEQVARIRQDVRDTGHSKCPVDGMELTVSQIPRVMPDGHDAEATCPRCRRWTFVPLD